MSITVLLIHLFTYWAFLSGLQQEELMDRLIFYPPTISERNGWCAIQLRFYPWRYPAPALQHVSSTFLARRWNSGFGLYSVKRKTALRSCTSPRYFGGVSSLILKQTQLPLQSTGASGSIGRGVLIFEPVGSWTGLHHISPVSCSVSSTLAVSYALDINAAAGTSITRRIYGERCMGLFYPRVRPVNSGLSRCCRIC